MPEPDEATGEVYDTEAEAKVVALMTPDELVDYEPVTPEQMEELIFHLGLRVERAPGVITKLYEDVHRKTEAYQLAKANAVLEHGGQISFARFYAETQTADQLRELNMAKEALRYAEELAQALRTKYFGFLNINKSISTQFMGTARFR